MWQEPRPEAGAAGTTEGAAVQRALAVLAALDADGGALPLTALARRLGCAKSTIHRTLAALVASGLVDRDGLRYAVRVRPSDGAAVTWAVHRGQLRRALSPAVGELFARLRLTTSAAVLDGGQVVYPYRIHGPDGGWTTSDETGRAPALATASGAALLAWNQPAAQQLATAAALSARQRAQLFGWLAETRQAGVAVRTDSRSGLVCLAAPVVDQQARPTAALVLRGHVRGGDLAAAVQQLRTVAESATLPAVQAG
ncbi:IclR family transcriptional regulator domain-containing protein [Angustibacter sp. McL0619]|uniref:IclR family transcriptional regulator domain-containing protein n=1 Tax=Angustibacter sp. McL0619 TaxID=3415676 RepID=UPI003CF1DE05